MHQQLVRRHGARCQPCQAGARRRHQGQEPVQVRAALSPCVASRLSSFLAASRLVPSKCVRPSSATASRVRAQRRMEFVVVTFFASRPGESWWVCACECVRTMHRPVEPQRCGQGRQELHHHLFQQVCSAFLRWVHCCAPHAPQQKLHGPQRWQCARALHIETASLYHSLNRTPLTLLWLRLRLSR